MSDTHLTLPKEQELQRIIREIENQQKQETHW